MAAQSAGGSRQYGRIMDKVLIVENQRRTLEHIREGFKDLHHFELLTASTLKTAVDIMNTTRIAVLATGIRLPQGDGLDLLALMTRKYSSIPCIVMLEKDDPKPWFIDRTGHTGVLYYLKKPFSFGRLASAIFVGLNLRDEGQTRNGLAMTNFLPLVAIARKTCQMEIKSGSRQKGICYFENGRLLDARTMDFKGDAAAKQIADWRAIQIAFSPLSPQNREARVSMDLLTLAKATWEKGSKNSGSSAPSTPHKAQSSSPAGSKFEEALRKHADVLRSTKGYKGLAIANSSGEILASDTSQRADIDFSAISEMSSQMFTDCSRHLSRKGLGRCHGLSLHTDQGILIVRTTDMYVNGNYRFLALMAEDGNCYFMQTQLNSLIPKILSEASGFGKDLKNDLLLARKHNF